MIKPLNIGGTIIILHEFHSFDNISEILLMLLAEMASLEPYKARGCS